MRKWMVSFLFTFFAIMETHAQTKARPSGTTPPAPESIKSNELAGRQPKAIFLLKRARVDSAIGEPVLYPFERQTRTLYYELPAGVISNEPN